MHHRLSFRYVPISLFSSSSILATTKRFCTTTTATPPTTTSAATIDFAATIDPFSFEDFSAAASAVASSSYSTNKNENLTSSSSFGSESSSSLGTTTTNQRENRSTGVVTKWVDEKGFGFINLQGKSLFVHARDLIFDSSSSSNRKNSRLGKLSPGQTVEFTVGTQPDGRLKATSISSVGGDPLPTDGKENTSNIISDSEHISKTNNNTSSHSRSNKTKTSSNTTTPSYFSSHIAKSAKLFSSYQWNCVENGNPAVDGYKVTNFPTNLQGENEIPVPSEKWNESNNDDEEEKISEKEEGERNNMNQFESSSHNRNNSNSNTSNSNNSNIPPPSSQSRPIYDSELLGWPAEFCSREMDFFDVQELEETRTGWFDSSPK